MKRKKATEEKTAVKFCTCGHAQERHPYGLKDCEYPFCGCNRFVEAKPMTDKLTEALRAKCEEATIEIFGDGKRHHQAADIIQRHIAPLVQSLRDEVIEECANTHKCKLLMSPGATKPCKELGLKGTELCSECRSADTIRALKGVR